MVENKSVLAFAITLLLLSSVIVIVLQPAMAQTSSEPKIFFLSRHGVANVATPTSTTASSDSSSQNNIVNPILSVKPSWQLDSLKNSNVQGNVKVDKSTNDNAIKLSGSGFVEESVKSPITTTSMSKLTLSAWVKPDYSQGSPQFTIISKENSFILAINNNIPPTHIAVFSVFDGIKWNTVSSTTEITEKWTHLVATYDGSNIGIYVDGKLESTYTLPGIPILSTSGQLETQNVGAVSSGSDVSIGAYHNTLRGVTSNLFSGSLDDVKSYDSLLSDSQISQLYKQTMHQDN